MIVLTSFTDSIFCFASAAAALNVHASWVDWNGSTPTPGRQNSVITGTSALVVGAPGAGLQRCLKYLSFYNAGTSSINLAVYFSISGTDVNLLGNAGTSTIALAPGSQAIYADGEGWRVTDGAGNSQATSQTGCLLQVSVLASTAEEFFTFHPHTTFVRIRGVGGGGGGGGASSHASDAGASGGGGAGGYCEYFGNVVGDSGNTTYICGTGGNGGSSAVGGAGAASQFNLFGGFITLVAGGGAGGAEGTVAATVTVRAGGAGGTSTGGTINAAGAPGRRGLCPFVGSGTTEVAIGGSGGTGPFGAGGQGATPAVGVAPAPGYGGGGSGVATGASSAVVGGAGGPGLWIVEEYS
jgi:hypothetical protein